LLLPEMDESRPDIIFPLNKKGIAVYPFSNITN